MRKKGLLITIFMIIAFVVIPMSVYAQGLEDLESLPYDPTQVTTLGIILNVISLIISILIAIYMYKDAENRGKSGILWGIIGFCCGCIGLIIWLIIRPPIQQAPPPGYYPPPQQPGYPPQQQYYPPPQQPGYPPQQQPPPR
jgi:predicted cobalt transporter CbtA